MTQTLSDAHRKFLVEHAIDPDILAERGAYTAQTHNELPPRINCPTPALCFPLDRLDGSRVWQARPDRPLTNAAGRTLKYVSQWGESGVIFNASGRNRWKTADTILLTEGTKQSFCAAEYAPDGVAVVGLLGCSNWTTGGNPAAGINDLIRSKARRIVVAFDADIRTNPHVWRSAALLGRTIESASETLRPGRPLEVLFSTVANDKGTKKADIDGILGTYTPAERRREIKRIVDEAAHLPAWGKDSDLPVIVLPDMGLTLANGENAEPPSHIPTVPPDGVVMNAALSIDTAYQWIADPRHPERRHPDTTLDLDLSIWRSGLPPEHHLLRGETWTTVQDLGSLTLKGSGPAGLTVVPPAKPLLKTAILESMRRRADTARLVYQTPRTGWQRHPETGQWMWACPQGAIGADGWDRDFRAKVNDVVGRVHLSWPDEASDKEAAEALVMLTAGLRHLFAEPVRADACLAGYALSFLPIPPKCAIALFGEFSKGKSTIMQTYSALLSPDWTPRTGTTEFNFYATENAVGKSMDYVDHMPVFYDDMKKPTSKTERQRLNDTFDAIVRRCHGSQAKMRAGVDPDRGVILADRDDSQPLAFIVGERIPSDAAASALSRVFQIPMRSELSLATGDTLNTLLWEDDEPGSAAIRLFKDRWLQSQGGSHPYDKDGSNTLEGLYRLTGCAAWRRITPAWVEYLACCRTQTWPLSDESNTRDFQTYLEDRRVAWSRAVTSDPRWLEAKRQGVRLSTREAIIVASMMTGLELWMRFATAYTAEHTPGPLADEVSHMAGQLDTIFGTLIETHLAGARENEGDDTGETNILDVLRSAVASERARIIGLGSVRERDYRPVIGQVTTVDDDTEIVAIDPKTVIRELRLDMTDRDLVDALAPIAVRDKAGRARRPIRINKVSTRAVCIPKNLWGEDDDEGF